MQIQLAKKEDYYTHEADQLVNLSKSKTGIQIFYDVDTQNDFINENGALYVPGAESIRPSIRILDRFARKYGIPIIGSVDHHFGTEEYKQREMELARNGGPFPDHCMNKNTGQVKILETRAQQQVFHPHYLDDKIDTRLLEKVDLRQGLFFEKQNYDVFTNPAIKRFLEMVNVTEAIVYGVATDYCVKAAVLGMQKRGIQCYVIEDAIKGVDEKTAKAAIKEMKEAGAKFVKTKTALEKLIQIAQVN